MQIIKIVDTGVIKSVGNMFFFPQTVVSISIYYSDDTHFLERIMLLLVSE